MRIKHNVAKKIDCTASVSDQKREKLISIRFTHNRGITEIDMPYKEAYDFLDQLESKLYTNEF